jgi:signal peptidase II
MKKFFTQGRLVTLVVAGVLIIDQLIKIAVKTNMYLHENIHVTDWFYIYFTENNGMAFGLEIFAKLFLTLFRIVAAILITVYLVKLVKRTDKVKNGYLVCLSLILAGAVGNIIDCVFYGEIFSESTHSQIASWVPLGQGYSDWLHGKVVDMFYFPIIDTYWPDWMPFVGGDHFIFFSPIFNFADAAISCGIIALLIFYSHYLNTAPHAEQRQHGHSYKRYSFHFLASLWEEFACVSVFR